MSQVTTDSRYIRCSQCQNQMRPIWTSKAMHCPCCHNLIKLTRYDIRSPASMEAKCILKEKLRSKFKSRNSSSSSSSGTSSNRYSVPESGMTSASKPHPGKRAVLCGVSYKKRKYELKGTINDVKHMKELLIRTFGFLEENIRVLTGTTTHVYFSCLLVKAFLYSLAMCEVLLVQSFSPDALPSFHVFCTLFLSFSLYLASNSNAC